MLCSPVLTSVFPSLMRRRLRDQKMQKMERVREPATRFGEDPVPWRSFILLRRLLQHRFEKQLPTWAGFKAHLWHVCRSSFLCFVHWCSTYRLRLWSDALFWRVGGGPQRTPCSPWDGTFTFFSEKHFRQQWPPCFPPGGRLLLLVGHDPHSLSDWSLGCHFRSPHSPLRATRRTRPEKWKFSGTLEARVKVPIF